jgi:predicted DNA-binding protein (UPF0251 family)
MPKIEIDTDEMVSMDDAAEQLNISIATAWRLKRNGRLKTTTLFGRTLVSKADLESARVELSTVPNP